MLLWNECSGYVPEEVMGKMEKYIEKCTRLCWRLVTHKPPLIVSMSRVPGTDTRSEPREPFDPERHEVCKDIDCGAHVEHHSQSHVAEVIWPALLDHRGRILSKAEVILALRR